MVVSNSVVLNKGMCCKYPFIVASEMLKWQHPSALKNSEIFMNENDRAGQTVGQVWGVFLIYTGEFEAYYTAEI